MPKTPDAPPPIGLIAAIQSGFEAVNTRPWIALGPFLLDVFLWLGPRLSIAAMFQETLTAVQSDLTALIPAESLRDWQAIQAGLLEFSSKLNLFANLSTSPLGVPSLLAARVPAQAPLAFTLWPVTDPFLYLLSLFTLTVAGYGLGAMYLDAIAGAVRDPKLDAGPWLRRWLAGWARLIALAIGMWVILIVIGGPLFIMASVLTQWNGILGSVVMVIGSTVIFWMLFYAALAVPGVFVQRRGVLRAVWESAQLVQLNLNTVAGLYLVGVVLNLGLSWLWNIPTDDSWWLLFGIGGHALVATALLAATFALYQDRYQRWLAMRAPAPAANAASRKA